MASGRRIVMVPRIDLDVGMSVYSTASGGTGGSIRNSTGDFVVRELLDERALSNMTQDGGYAVYVLKKRGVDTNHALRTVYGRTGMRLKALGLKDARAVTEQYVCAANRSRSVDSYESGGISLRRIGHVRKPLSKRDMAGNRFAVRIADPDGRPDGFDGFDRVLNFYGYQRFGSQRPVSHLVGRALVRGDFDLAVELLLSFTSVHDRPENTRLRERLSDRSNFREALADMPPGMDLERTVVSRMIERDDAKAAFRALPLQMRRFFVQAYQSFIFNLALSASWGSEDLFGPEESDVCFGRDGVLGRYSGDPGQSLAVPIVGYSYYSKTRFDGAISRILGEQGVRPKDFFIREMQELSSEGGFRSSAVRCRDVRTGGDLVEFTLSRGSFATVVLREIIKPGDPFGCGF